MARRFKVGYHFFPINDDPDGTAFDGWTLLAAMAVDTSHAQIGVIVTGAPYRNPDLLADMARTVDHLSAGRTVLGIGAGWSDKDFTEYGYEQATTPDRLRALEVTLRLVAQYADMWNTFGPLESWTAKNKILDDWCARVGRDPADIERTVFIRVFEIARVDEYVAAGAQHVVIGGPAPFDLGPLRTLLAAADR